MSAASVVIGANFGDEGKGLITDFEARRLNPRFVTRFNGGAQAGHTVTTSDGRRHVFGHVSSGTFAGSDTFLSSNFIFNPLALTRELHTLDKVSNVKSYPHVLVSDKARVTTIYDMLINGIIETLRGNDRHGSCGMGINETVTRHEFFPMSFGSLRFNSTFDIETQLEKIYREWVPKRLAQLGIDSVPKDFVSALYSTDLSKVAHDMKSAVELHASPGNWAASVKRGPLVFEGAQGLMLDEFMGEFPHVTRSITGLPAAIVAAAELNVKSLKPIYVTRAYLTRHGAGRLENEGIEFGAADSLDDQTNVENPWQGKIRYAPLEPNMLRSFIEADLERAKFVAQALGVTIEPPTLAVTCLDQIHSDVTVIDCYDNPRTCKVEVPKDDLPEFLVRRFDPKYEMSVSHVSRGPTAADVEYIRR